MDHPVELWGRKRMNFLFFYSSDSFPPRFSIKYIPGCCWPEVLGCCAAPFQLLNDCAVRHALLGRDRVHGTDHPVPQRRMENHRGGTKEFEKLLIFHVNLILKASIEVFYLLNLLIICIIFFLDLLLLYFYLHGIRRDGEGRRLHERVRVQPSVLETRA